MGRCRVLTEPIRMVAVGRLAGHVFSADGAAAGAGPVFNDDVGGQALAQSVGDLACNEVGAANGTTM